MSSQNLDSPVHPADREQQRLEREADERKKQEDARKAQIIEQKGDELRSQAEAHDARSKELQDATARLIAEKMAKEHKGLADISWNDFEEALGRAQKAEEAATKAAIAKELEASSPKLQNDATPPPVQGQHEASLPRDKPAEVELQTIAATLDRRHGKADYSALSQPQGEKPIVNEFRAAAREVTEPAPPPGNSPGQGNRGGPTPDGSASSSTSQVLRPTDALDRFTDAAARKRYDSDNQQREDAAKSNLASADPATRGAAQRNGSPQIAREDGLMASFVTAATKQKAEAEKAEKQKEQAQGMQRGGRGR